jgi:hypothetical protein
MHTTSLNVTILAPSAMHRRVWMELRRRQQLGEEKEEGFEGYCLGVSSSMPFPLPSQQFYPGHKPTRWPNGFVGSAQFASLTWPQAQS